MQQLRDKRETELVQLKKALETETKAHEQQVRVVRQQVPRIVRVISLLLVCFSNLRRRNRDTSTPSKWSS